MDAFELRTIPDVYPGRADRDALQAVDAVTTFGYLGISGFPPFEVVNDGDRVAVEQYSLHSAVRAK